GLRVDVLRAVLARLRVDLVAVGAEGALGADGGAADPGRVLDALRGLLAREDHGDRAVRRGARLRVADRIPEDGRRLDLLERLLEVEVRVGVEQAVLTILHRDHARSEEHTSELQSRENLVCRLLLEKKKQHKRNRSVT